MRMQLNGSSDAFLAPGQACQHHPVAGAVDAKQNQQS